MPSVSIDLRYNLHRLPPMSDPLRTDALARVDAASEADRDAKIEQLLLVGLDHYFAAQLRARHQRLDARAVSRSQPRAGPRLHRAGAQRARRAAARIRRAAAERRRRVPIAATATRRGVCCRPPSKAARRRRKRWRSSIGLNRLGRLSRRRRRSGLGASDRRPAGRAVPSVAFGRWAGGPSLVLRASSSPARLGRREPNAFLGSIRMAIARRAGQNRPAPQRPAPARDSTLPPPVPRRGETCARARARADGQRSPARRAHRARVGSADRSAEGRRRSPARRHPASVARHHGAARTAVDRPRQGRPTRSMKCPKCGYLGFERVERCRNCGYDFSLTSPITVPDVAIRRDTRTINPIDDLSLIDAAAVPQPSGVSSTRADLDRVFGTCRPRPTAEAETAALRLADNGRHAAHHEAVASAARRCRCAASTPEVPLRREQPRSAQTSSISRSTFPLAPRATRCRRARAADRRAVRRRACRRWGLGARRCRGARPPDPRRDRRRGDLFHDADLRPDGVRSSGILPKGPLVAFLCWSRTAATSWRSRPAGRRSARWRPASRSCRPSPGSPRSRPRLPPHADVASAGDAPSASDS